MSNSKSKTEGQAEAETTGKTQNEGQAETAGSEAGKTNGAADSEAEMQKTVAQEVERILAEARAQAEKIKAEAEAEKAKLLEEAQAAQTAQNAQNAPDPKATARVNKAKAPEEMVSVRLFKDNGRYKDDVFVAVNGRRFLIKRGETVRVPKCVADVLAQSQDQDQATAALIEAKSAEFAEESKARNI